MIKGIIKNSLGTTVGSVVINKGKIAYKSLTTKKVFKTASELFASLTKDEPIVLTGKELGEFAEDSSGYKQLQQAAFDYASSLIGQHVFSRALAANVFVRKSGVKKLTRLGSSRIKLKLIPATLSLLSSAKKLNSEQSSDPSEHNIKAYHKMSATALVGKETARVYMIVKEDDKGVFLYEEFVNKKALTGIASVASELNSAALDGLALNQGYETVPFNTSSSQAILDSVGDSMVLNLFLQIKDPVTGEWVDLPDDEVIEEETTSSITQDSQTTNSGEVVAGDPQKQTDIDFLQSVIDGKVDVMSDDFDDKLEILAVRYDGDRDMELLINKAVDYYQEISLAIKDE